MDRRAATTLFSATAWVDQLSGFGFGIATSGLAPTAFAVDATSLYWIDNLAGTVMKLTPK